MYGDVFHPFFVHEITSLEVLAFDFVIYSSDRDHNDEEPRILWWMWRESKPVQFIPSPAGLVSSFGKAVWGALCFPLYSFTSYICSPGLWFY